MKYKIFLIVLLSIIYASCSNCNHDEIDPETTDPGHGHEIVDTEITDDGHNHGDVTNQFTAYSNEYELFAEADPFVVGETSHILAHFSTLPNFKAIENGSATVRLVIDDKEAKQTLTKPTRKGIYSFEIEPKTEGKGVLFFDIKTDEGEFRVEVPDVWVFTDEHDAIHHAGEAVLPTTNVAVFTKEQSWKTDFASQLPKEGPFGQVIKTTAQIQPAQGSEILVPAHTNGILMLSANNVLEGMIVSKGEVLFSISGSGLANNNSSVRWVEAKNNYEKAKSDWERSKKLAEDKIVSEKDLLNAKHKYDNAKVIYDNLNKNFNSSGEIVSSPMNGFVSQLFVNNGQYVEAGQAIVSIAQNEKLILAAQVQQKYAPILGSINSANIRTLFDNKTYTLEQLNGKVLSWGKTTSTDNYLIPVNLQIDNKSSFIAGSFVEIYLKTLTNARALTIPNSALLEEQGNFFVFVQVTPELFEKHEVKLGATDGLKTEITQGLNQSERIVTRGAIMIKLAQATGSLDAHSGHVH
jgi:RND family efflux transporter MFP subunit